MYASSTSLKSRAARPMKKFDSPGETPQSTTAVEPRSRGMTRTMRPAPRIEIRMMAFRSGYPIGPRDSDDEAHETPLDRLGRGRRGGGERSGGGAGFGRAGGSPDSSPATKVGGLSRT